MEKRCCICGAVGFEDVLATCMECKSFFIHLYCMKTVRLDIPDDWICENCQETPKLVTSKSTIGLPVHKRVIQLIPTNAAVALASPSSLSKGEGHHPSLEKACKTLGVPIKRLKSFKNMVPHATLLCDVHVCSPDKPSCLPSSEHNSRKEHSMHAHMPPGVHEPSSKQKSCIKYPLHAHTPSLTSEPSPDLQTFKELFILPTCTMSKKPRHVFSQGRDPWKDTLKSDKNAREQRPIFGKLTMDKDLPNHLASVATWKGSFRIGFAASSHSCDNVWGYPPQNIKKKAYEFSTKMPAVLHFEAIPRYTVSETLFKDGGPDKDDIGLYFLPICDRSEECYFRLLSHIEEEGIVLKSCICGIRLLIFSSSCLEEKSREINKSYYLWGLFVLPGITFKKPDQMQLPAKLNSEPASQHNPSNEQDVDMLGGAPLVDKFEVPVPRDSLLTSLKKSNAGSQSASEVQVQVKTEKWDDVELPSPPGLSALPPEPRVPPGFEECGRVKYKSIDEILNSKKG